MKHAMSLILGVLLLFLSTIMSGRWTMQADLRLSAAQAEAESAPSVAVASHANEAYCTPRLQKILRRVLDRKSVAVGKECSAGRAPGQERRRTANARC